MATECLAYRFYITCCQQFFLVYILKVIGCYCGCWCTFGVKLLITFRQQRKQMVFFECFTGLVWVGVGVLCIPYGCFIIFGMFWLWWGSPVRWVFIISHIFFSISIVFMWFPFIELKGILSGFEHAANVKNKLQSRDTLLDKETLTLTYKTIGRLRRNYAAPIL